MVSTVSILVTSVRSLVVVIDRVELVDLHVVVRNLSCGTGSTPLVASLDIVRGSLGVYYARPLGLGKVF